MSESHEGRHAAERTEKRPEEHAEEQAKRIAGGLADVRARIARACLVAGRDPGEVELLAVSKRHDEAAIRAAYALGQRSFGENYVQELEQKARALRDLPELRWRFIGHLQRNKAKVLAPLAAEVHLAVDGVDSLRTAEALDRRAGERSVEVLLQVNIAREAQKSGVDPDALPELISELRALPRLVLRGLMLIPPAGDPEEARPHFRALRKLADLHGLPVRSMGMSDDLEVAVQEGATMVRVGTAIFGQRPR